jgi:hypothetical protein
MKGLHEVLRHIIGAQMGSGILEFWLAPSLLCRPTLAGLGPPRTVCLLWLAIRLPVVCH